MKVIVRITQNFKKEVKPLLKKYPSLSKDLLALQLELVDHPKLGTSLGNSLFKIRLKISSKGKGKSGGARIISLLENNLIVELTQEELETTVNLISIYDKSVTENLSDKELKRLVKDFYSEG